jgi:glycosyltransferase involved in cell wall biosynthesis
MHDMWNITGGCHHSFTCEKYKSHCFDCPMLPTKKTKDLSFKGFEKKLNLYSKHNNLYFISPSKWLYECAKQSALTKNKPLFHIPNILEKTIFKPFDKAIAKKLLNLNPNEVVVAFGATSIDSPYKGWNYLLKALKILASESEFKKMSVIVFGGGYKKEIADEIPFQTMFTGYLRDEYSPVMVYNAADVFIAPSLADNLPTTVLESLNCGTSVVGFDVGGIPDMIKHKENGYIAKYKNADDIAEGIKFCINNKVKGYNLPEFETDSILEQHKSLFSKILSLENLK